MARLNRPSVTEGRRLYLLDITMPSGMQCVKIGVASGDTSLDRMMQVNRAIFQKYRKTAMIGIKRDRQLDEDVFKYETELHHFFAEWQYVPKIAFDGSTELFAVPLDSAVEVYEYLLDNGLGSLEGLEYELPETRADELKF